MKSSKSQSIGVLRVSRRKLLVTLLALIVVVTSLALLRSSSAKTYQQPTPEPNTLSNHASIEKTYGKLPLSFGRNDGQVDNQVRFIAHGEGCQLFLTGTEAVRALGTTKASNKTTSVDGYQVVRMGLVHWNENAATRGEEQLPGKLNYFIGSDQSKWKTDVPLFAKVRYDQIYEGINLVYYGNQSQLDLYVVGNSGQADQDPFVTKINPSGNAIVYSTYLGGPLANGSTQADDFASGVAVDPGGNAYVTGIGAAGFPVTPGAFGPSSRFSSGFVVKVSQGLAITGAITNAGSVPQSGVKVTLSGSKNESFITGSDGTYQFVNLVSGGNYTVSATKTGSAFTPPSTTFNNLNADQVANFTLAPSATPFHTISGQMILLDSITPLVGVNVALTGSQVEFTTTDANGNYSFSAPAGGNYTVTASLLGFNFIPPSHNVNNLNANTTLNFQAVRLDFVVTNTNDFGAGSLRQAMLDANVTQGADRIRFNIPGAGVKTIDVKAPLPVLTDPVTIDGTTQPGYAVGQPLIELNGTDVGLEAPGIRIISGSSTVRGLVINRFDSAGIMLQTGGNNQIEANVIGLDPSGTTKRSNRTHGIVITGSANVIGGTTAAQRNIISGNNSTGISMSGSNNVVTGNYIGTNAAGTEALSNINAGVFVDGGLGPANNRIGGPSPGAGNVISGNGLGMEVRANLTTVQGNIVGLNAAGTAEIPNGTGISLEGNQCVVGGTQAAERNIISGNTVGIDISVSLANPVGDIKGNFIGTDSTGNSAIGNDIGILSDSTVNIGGDQPGAGNVISGNDFGILLTCCHGGGFVYGNLIGVSANGNKAVANLTGISIQSSSRTIGGSQTGARNVISGNVLGILIGGQLTPGPSSNAIVGNYFGLNAAGDAPVPNETQAILFSDSSSNVIGGDQPGEGNIIAFNGAGIQFGTIGLPNGQNNLIKGNSIFSNARLGINLTRNDVVTANDFGDADEGANHLQNFPVLSTITPNGEVTNVKGTLSSNPNTQYRIDFYSNLACDSSGNGEGARPFGTTQVTTNSGGTATIDVTLQQALATGRTVTATATDPNGSTSEFSPCNSSLTTGSVEFVSSTFNALEDVGSATIKVVRIGGTRGSLTVNYSTANGTATAGSDYTAASGTFVFAQGETEKTISVPIANDGTIEPDETVQLILSGTSELEFLGGKPIAVLHIFDASAPLVLSALSDVAPINIRPVAEGDFGTRNVPVSVRLSAQTSRTISVNYATSASSATAGTDYQNVSGTLTFTPGSEIKDILIPVIGDTLDENNENITLSLTNPVNATLSSSVVSVQIVDDDVFPQVFVSDVTAVEGPNAKATFTFHLSTASGRASAVFFNTANGTATSGSDYAQTSGNLIFAAGETVRQVEVPILTDGSVEPDETFFLNLIGSSFLTVVDGQAVGTILDASSTSPLVQFSASSFTGNEDDKKIQAVVTRTGSTAAASTVNYRTLAQSASERSDFTPVSGTLQFAAGETSKNITVLLTDDTLAEPTETLLLTLSSPTGAALGGPSVVPLNIVSNDIVDTPSPVRPATFNSAFFVRQHYHDFLNREPDAAGLGFWMNEIDSCPDEPCREVKKINVSAAFFLSIEFQETGYLAYRAYRAAYGDTTSPNVAVPVPVIRLSEFLPDSQRISQGVQVGIGNWEQVLEENKVAYFLEFVQKQRFIADYPLSLTPAAFVDKLNLRSGNVLSQSERDQLVAELTAAPTVTQGRASVLRKVADDSTLKQNEKNRAFVLMQYYGYLRRNPDDPQDTDFRGWEFWLGKLNQFNGDFVNAEMVKAFITSGEYIERFGR